MLTRAADVGEDFVWRKRALATITNLRHGDRISKRTFQRLVPRAVQQDRFGEIAVVLETFPDNTQDHQVSMGLCLRALVSSDPASGDGDDDRQ